MIYNLYIDFRLYQGLSLWLEESRLHDPNLYIDVLPDAYIPGLLVKVFQGNEVEISFYLLYSPLILKRFQLRMQTPISNVA